MNIYWIGLGIIVAGIIFLVAGDAMFGLGEVDASKIATLVAMSAILIIVAPWMMNRYRSGGAGMALRHIVIWLAIVAVIGVIYRYREALGLDIP